VSEPLVPVSAVIVNWRGWRDTICCLDSLLELGGTPMRVVVCDNGSGDDSAAELARWMQERLDGWQPAPGSPGFAAPAAASGVSSVHLLRLPGNLGYAGGLNAGISWADGHWRSAAYWLLNNDVLMEPGALDALVAAERAVPNAGVCGSVLLEWDDPRQVQAVAGVFRRWLGVGWHRKDLPGEESDISLDVDYPVGASVYVTREYLERVGPMDPSYFLYSEEMDWVERGRRHGFRPVVALRSRMRHKEGASTASRGGVRHKSLLSERYGVINRLRITRKFWPHLLPVVWLSLFAVIGDRLVHGEYARARLILRLMASPRLWLR
jgi:GT2 family glycosyltransferase